MFKTTKSKIAFVTVFCLLCIMITVGAVIYKNIEIEDINQENNQEIVENQDNVSGIDLKGTYSQNDISLTEKKASKDKVEIVYYQINGLNDTIIQNSINRDIESVALNCYKETVKDLNEVENVFVSIYCMANFANTLSLEVSYTGNMLGEEDGFFQGFKGLNYDLTTGEKIKFEKLFTANAPMEDILRKSAYYSLIKRNLKDNLSGDKVVNDYGDVEDDVAFVIEQYKKAKIEEFSFSPKVVNIFYENQSIIEIDMSKYAEYIAIYNRYANSENNLYKKNDIGLKGLYTLSNRTNESYAYRNYQKGSNYYIDVNLWNFDEETNKVSIDVEQTKIAEIEKEITKIKNLIYKNPDNFYILNYNISISTNYDSSVMKDVTNCSTLGNSYEMTVHDFEENVEPIIIQANRQNIEGAMDEHVYYLSDVLKIEPQTTQEYYDSETGEKIVI